jgi:sugar O-acyltransferase (sialic acid O-acetyltransferase NeuD family)
MQKMIFWGATGQAKALRECMSDTGLRLVALFDNNPDVHPPFADVPLYYGQSGFQSWRAQQRVDEPIGFLVAIGGFRGRDRVALYQYLESQGLVPLVAQHRTAFVAADASIGAGSQIFAQASVCVDVTLGRSCIINTNASVDHECRLGEGVHISVGARLAGRVTVGDYASVGVGATILPHLTIGTGAIVGAGAVVIRDVPPAATVVGNPARRIA